MASTTQSKSDLTGARAFVALLRAHGVDTVFGYPGAAALSLFDELYAAQDIKVILPRHEQGAVHMADGYARATGKTGVVLVTSGPGATNTVTGIATAYMDSVPLVIFTAQVATSVLGTDAFQESDITGITLPITKHNYLVSTGEELVEAVSEAFYIASTGRPGPVLIDIPVDVSQALCTGALDNKISLPGYRPTVKGHAKQITQAAGAIRRAARPVFYIGGGVIVAGADRELKELAEAAQIPVVTTLMGRGAFPEDHHLWAGMPGMHGSQYANYTLGQADTIFAIGVRFDDRITGKISEFAKGAYIVHVDIDPAEIGKLKIADVPIVGDAKDVLTKLLSAYRKEDNEPKSQDWLEQIDAWRAEFPLSYDKEASKVSLFPEYVVEKIGELTAGKDCIFTTEVGQNQMWAAQYLRLLHPRSWLSSGGLGTMGFGFPAALGAQVGRPEATVVAIAGDGSFQMNLQELATARENNLPVKVVILNNAGLGMVRQWQDLFYEKRFSASAMPADVPDFKILAQAYGIFGERVTTPAELEPALKAAFAYDGPAIVDCRIVENEMVFPMAKPNASVVEMLGGSNQSAIGDMLNRPAAGGSGL